MVVLGAIVAFAAIGGTGLAGSLVKPVKAQYGQYGPGQYVNPGKVTLCHKQKVTIRVSTRALPAHEAHGDTVGTCAAAAAKAKAAKADKAAAKAEKAAARAAAKAEKAAAKAGQSAPDQGGQATTPAPKANNGQGKAKGKGK